MTMMTQWENSTMSFHDTKEMEGKTEETKQITLKIMCKMLGLPLRHVRADDTCPYCEKPRHTREQCWARKFDGDLKDKVKILIPSLKKIYKAQEEILQQGGLRPHQEKTMRSILHTLQGTTVGGDRIKEVMDTDKYHQVGSMKSKEHAYARKQPRDLRHRGRVTSPQSTQDREDQEYEEGDQSYE